MPAPILVNPGTRFTCIPCGFCCGFWDIHIDSQRKDSLEEKDWVKTLSRDLDERKHRSLFKILGQGDQSLIQRRRGSCGFLDDRLLCSIHATEGFNAKPLVCQQYPNIYYETPRGVEVFLDYSCPEVIRNIGEPVTREAVARTLPREYVQKANSTFPLNPRTTLDWDGYLCLEEAFLRILAKPMECDERILHLDQLTKELGRKLENHPFPQRKTVSEALAEIEAADMTHLSRRVQQLPSNPSKRDLYLAILVQWVESTFSAEVSGTAMGSGKVIRNILRQWRGIGDHTFEVFKFRVNYKHMRSIGFSAEAAVLREPLDRYLDYQVKTLVGTGEIPIARRLGIIATNFALVKWFSRAQAASSGTAQVSLDDIVFGIKVVEKFLSIRLFNKLSAQKSFLSKYVNLLFDNPSLPGTMLSRP
jgi:lysine-N-methylase